MKRNQKGFIVSIELIFLATILVIGLLAGWVMIRDTTLGELQDVANAIGSVNQSYTYNGTSETDPLGIEFTNTAGSSFFDTVDTSDQQIIFVGEPPTPEILVP